MNRKVIVLLMLWTVGLILLTIVGCGLKEDTVSDVSRDGNVEVSESSYYANVMTFMDESGRFVDSTFDEVNMSEIFDDKTKKKVVDESLNYIGYLRTIKLEPSTEEEHIIHEEVLNAIYNAEQMAHHGLQFAETEDFTHRKLHKDYFDDFLINIKTINAITEQLK